MRWSPGHLQGGEGLAEAGERAGVVRPSPVNCQLSRRVGKQREVSRMGLSPTFPIRGRGGRAKTAASLGA